MVFGLGFMVFNLLLMVYDLWFVLSALCVVP
jgi:hypothetical protein